MSLARLALAAAVVLLLSTGSTGCATGKPSVAPAIPPAPIHELNLLALPSAVNLDGKPGADGVVVKIFAVPRGATKAAPLRTGTLEVLAYEGTVEDTLPPAPLHVWRFDPAQLKAHEFTTMLGIGYNLVLDWSPQILAATRVTVIARYFPPEGDPIASAPSFVAVTAL